MKFTLIGILKVFNGYRLSNNRAVRYFSRPCMSFAVLIFGLIENSLIELSIVSLAYEVKVAFFKIATDMIVSPTSPLDLVLKLLDGHTELALELTELFL